MAGSLKRKSVVSTALNMLAIAFLAATLVVASPVSQQRRAAAVVSLPPRSSTHRIFNPEAVRRERLRVYGKYKGKEHLFRPAVEPEHTLIERSVGGPEPFDISRRATSGKDPLTDVFDTIDERESSISTRGCLRSYARQSTMARSLSEHRPLSPPPSTLIPDLRKSRRGYAKPPC